MSKQTTLNTYFVFGGSHPPENVISPISTASTQISNASSLSSSLSSSMHTNIAETISSTSDDICKNEKNAKSNKLTTITGNNSKFSNDKSSMLQKLRRMGWNVKDDTFIDFENKNEDMNCFAGKIAFDIVMQKLLKK